MFLAHAQPVIFHIWQEAYGQFRFSGDYENKPISQILPYTRPISHNAPLGTEMCTFLLQSGVLWDMGQVHCEIGLLSC